MSAPTAGVPRQQHGAARGRIVARQAGELRLEALEAEGDAETGLVLAQQRHDRCPIALLKASLDQKGRHHSASGARTNDRPTC